MKQKRLSLKDDWTRVEITLDKGETVEVLDRRTNQCYYGPGTFVRKSVQDGWGGMMDDYYPVKEDAPAVGDKKDFIGYKYCKVFGSNDPLLTYGDNILMTPEDEAVERKKIGKRRVAEWRRECP
jgi:hypothetical protein